MKVSRTLGETFISNSQQKREGPPSYLPLSHVSLPALSLIYIKLTQSFESNKT